MLGLMMMTGLFAWTPMTPPTVGQLGALYARHQVRHSMDLARPDGAAYEMVLAEAPPPESWSPRLGAEPAGKLIRRRPGVYAHAAEVIAKRAL